jgi:hypothetical protein
MKLFFLILGIALFVLGIQDGIRLLVDNETASIFNWVPGGFTFHIAIDIIIAIAGALLAKYGSKKTV